MMRASAPVSARFSNWPFAVTSIFGFWLLYGSTVFIRAFLTTDPWTAITNRLAILAFGVITNGLIYLVIGWFAHGASVRRKVAVAMASCVAGALILSTAVAATEGWVRSTQSEVRYRSREGFKVVAKGNQFRIELSAQEPLVITVPRLRELRPKDQWRFKLDMAVTWLFFFIGWSAFYVASEAQAATRKAERKLADAETAAQAAHVRALRYQINPHFLFNTLNSLSSLVMSGRRDRAEGMLMALSTFFRTSLTLDPSADVTLAEEIDLQRLYLDIEMARFPDRLEVHVRVPPDLENALMPALILQPIVENAIKYGVSKSREGVTILIEARRLDGGGSMAVEISDRPRDLRDAGSAPRAQGGTGVGLLNVCQRLDARWGARARCRYGPLEGGGYQVSLTMPLEIAGPESRLIFRANSEPGKPIV